MTDLDFARYVPALERIRSTLDVTLAAQQASLESLDRVERLLREFEQRLEVRFDRLAAKLADANGARGDRG